MQLPFTWQDVIRLTGITTRQLQWDERGLEFERREHLRIYSLEEPTAGAAVREPRRKRFSFERMREVVRFLKKEFRRRLAETVRGSSNYHLITDGHALYGETLPYGMGRLIEKFPAADVCHLPERYGSRSQGPGWRRETPRPPSSGESAFHARREIELAVNLP